MRYLFIIVFFLVGYTTYAQEKTIQLELKGEASMEEVILQLEKDYGFLFSYKEADIQGITFTQFPQPTTIQPFLTALLKDQALQFEMVNDYIILTKRVIPKEEIGFLLCGKVIDSLTQSPLPFSNVYLKKSRKGTSSKEDGSFQFRASFDPSDTLVISYVGYQEKKILAAQCTKNNCPTITLAYFNLDENFVVVTEEYLTDGIRLKDNGGYTELQPNDIGALPGQVEPDVLSTIQFLPGISAPDGSAAGICVRGGTPDQNLILWEDIPIYHSAHYFGTISAFNPYIIDKVAVYRGGFGAEYGGRISGVIDLKSDLKKNKKAHFGAGTNFINAYTNGHFSLLKKKLSVVYSLRRSMTELWRSPAFENLTKRVHQGILVQNVDLNKLPPGISINDDFKLFDTNVKVAYDLSPKDKLSVAFFYGNNKFKDLINDQKGRQDQADTLFLANIGTSIAWTRQWSEQFSTKLLGLSTDYHYDYNYSIKKEAENKPDRLGFKNSRINEQQIHLLNTYQTKTKHTFKLAYQLTKYDVAFFLARTNQNNTISQEGINLQSDLHVLYGAYKSPETNRFGVDAGLRLTHIPRDQDQHLEPRLRLWYDLTKHVNLYGNAGRYFQFLSQLYEIEGDRSSIETPVWALAGGKEVPVLKATQYQLGWVFHKKSWLLDFQAYTKSINGLTSLATGFDETLVNRFHIGDANILGVDILVKKRWRNYRTWLSYSLSKIEYNFPTFFDENFIAPNDQRHSLSWANMWTLGKFECALGWKIVSGSPYSLRENYEVRVTQQMGGSRESIFPLVKEFNSARLPMQHQLDASVLYHFQPQVGRWKGVVGVSLYNIYHQRNIYSREFYIKKPPNDPARLEYSDKVNMGFTANFVVRVEW